MIQITTGDRWTALVFISILLFQILSFLPNIAFADQLIETIPVGNNPVGIAVNPNTNRIYVSNINNNTISIIDGSTNSVVDTISVNSPSDVSTNSVTNMIYVVEGQVNHPAISVIDGSTNTIVQTIQIPFTRSGTSAHEIAVNPQTNMIYVTHYSSEHFAGSGFDGGFVVVINGTTNTYVSTLSVKGFPNGIAINQNTNKIYIANFAAFYNQNDIVSVIDGSTNSVNNEISVPNAPYFVTVNPDTNKVYVTESTGSKLAVIDGTTDRITTEIPVEFSPFGVGVNSNTNKIYVANHNSNTISVIDGTSNQVISSVSVGSGPAEVDVNPNTNKIYVTNYKSNSVSVIDGNLSATSSPQSLSANAASSSQINLSWAMPQNDGGSPITRYQIERSTNNGSTWSTIMPNTGSTGTTYSDTGLSPNTTYTYRVSAINSVGISPPSNTASATTLASIIVNARDTLNKPLTGIWMELHTANGDTVAKGYTPISFDVVQGTQYAVYAGNYMQHVFLRWDDGSTDPHRDITPAMDVTLTGIYTITTTDQLLK